jgi:hypothetical protein
MVNIHGIPTPYHKMSDFLNNILKIEQNESALQIKSNQIKERWDSNRKVAGLIPRTGRVEKSEQGS